ncbi:DUF3991 domain-containing protein [Lacticaseibacillus porcinae]|uniref:DUF3991 domain-containing protein n=1 Tax=Lacticaseibacillus porcinae TaxID=1123687 RepID=UPI001CDCCAAF|nr:DUF3991 domain-containing protein [Lacticaseibacillus porcinae]
MIVALLRKKASATLKTKTYIVKRGLYGRAFLEVIYVSWMEDFKRAKSASIVDVVQRNGINIEQESTSNWRGIEHDSFVVNARENTFYWNSRQQHGDPIDFMMNVVGVESMQAAVKLLNDPSLSRAEIGQRKTEPFQYNTRNSKDFTRANDYLTIARGLNPQLIATLHQKGFLQQNQNGDVVFVWAKSGRRVGAATQGTTIDYDENGRRGTIKRIMKNSEQDFGFNFSIGKPDRLLVFEAPIDALSYLSTHPETNNSMFLSMDGLKPVTVIKGIQYMYELTGNVPNSIGFGVDNDPAGHTFFDRMMKDHQFVVQETGEVLPYFNLMPHDRQIPQDRERVLRDVANTVGVDWRDLAAIEKAETNFNSKRELGNGFGFQSGFINGADNIDQPYTGTQYADRATEIATQMNSVTEVETPDFELLIRRLQPGMIEDVRGQLAGKISSYAQQFKQGYEPTTHPIKDWNDDLKAMRAESLSAALGRHAYANDEQQMVVDRTSNSDGTMHYQAVNRFDQTIGFFEADSPQEMAYLIKTYGYNAVDKQDERGMGAEVEQTPLRSKAQPRQQGSPTQRALAR